MKEQDPIAQMRLMKAAPELLHRVKRARILYRNLLKINDLLSEKNSRAVKRELAAVGMAIAEAEGE